MNKYAKFIIGSKINNNSNIYKTSGFPEAKNDDYSTLEFYEKEGKTRAIVQKSGFRDKNIFEMMTKINS